MYCTYNYSIVPYPIVECVVWCMANIPMGVCTEGGLLECCWFHVSLHCSRLTFGSLSLLASRNLVQSSCSLLLHGVRKLAHTWKEMVAHHAATLHLGPLSVSLGGVLSLPLPFHSSSGHLCPHFHFGSGARIWILN